MPYAPSHTITTPNLISFLSLNNLLKFLFPPPQSCKTEMTKEEDFIFSLEVLQKQRLLFCTWIAEHFPAFLFREVIKGEDRIGWGAGKNKQIYEASGQNEEEEWACTDT